jgi:iron complex outermembrane receptor protein
MTFKKIALAATTALMGTLCASAAFAQSTGSTTVNEIVITKKGNQSIGGLVTQQEAPKTRSIVTQEYISSQPAGANALSDLNLIPGVNFTNDDPYGMSGSGGHLSIRGIKGANVAELVDGVPLNDGGNYAIYAGELVDPEVIANVNVITGSTEIDAPTSSSLGGLININTLTPTKDFGGFLSLSGGSFDYGRAALLVNTGEFGPFGTRAWIEGSDQSNHLAYGAGGDQKKQVNAKIYQPLGHDGDFIALAGFWDEQNAGFYYGDDFASTGVTGGGLQKYPVCGSTGSNCTTSFNYGGLLYSPWNTSYSSGINGFAGHYDSTYAGAYYGVEQNPTHTGNLRGESLFTLLPNLKLTVDPSMQFVLANGEGATSISPSDPRLTGATPAGGWNPFTNAPLPAVPAILGSASKSNLPICTTNGQLSGQVTGVDLSSPSYVNTPTIAPGNNCGSSQYLASPSNTQTQRLTLNTSLIWDIVPGQLVQFSFAWDHAHVRQTGEYALLSQTNGGYINEFGGLQGYGTPILGVDGSIMQKRNRLTIAENKQFGVEYIGKWFDDHLRLDLGVRLPYYSRDLNQYCYTQPASNVYCTTNATIAAYEGSKAPTATAAGVAGYVVAPFHLHTSYNKPLPNLGLTWHFDQVNSVFFDYTQALNAPVNDDLYSIATVGNGTTASAVGADNVQPETSTTYEAGYRYQTARIKGTLDVYYLEDNNHIVQSFDQTTQDSIDQNVGSVHYYGVEGQIGATVVRHWNVYGSFAYNHSEYMSNIPYNASTVIPTEGKVAADTPEWTFGARTTYQLGDFTFGLQGKYVGKRYVTLIDDLSVPSYVTFDADIRWKMNWITHGTFLQLNVLNIFDTKYLGSLNTTSTNNSTLPYYSQPYAYQGTPQVIQLTLRTAF